MIMKKAFVLLLIGFLYMPCALAKDSSPSNFLEQWKQIKITKLQEILKAQTEKLNNEQKRMEELDISCLKQFIRENWSSLSIAASDLKDQASNELLNSIGCSECLNQWQKNLNKGDFEFMKEFVGKISQESM